MGDRLVSLCSLPATTRMDLSCSMRSQVGHSIATMPKLLALDRRAHRRNCRTNTTSPLLSRMLRPWFSKPSSRSWRKNSTTKTCSWQASPRTRASGYTQTRRWLRSWSGYPPTEVNHQMDKITVRTCLPTRRLAYLVPGRHGGHTYLQCNSNDDDLE